MTRAVALRWVALVLAVGALSVATVLAYTRLASSGPDPFDAGARLVPADAHLFASVDTDITSDPWRALPDILTRLGVQSDALEARDARLREAGLDYAKDVEPALGSIRAFAVAAQATGPSDAEFVAVVDSREPAAVADLVGRLVTRSDARVKRTASTDAARNLDVVTYAGGFGGSTVIARKGDLLYFGERLDAIQHFVDRLASVGPLSDAAQFKSLREQSAHDALVLSYVSGSAFDALGSAALEQVTPAYGFDPRGVAMLVSASVTKAGFEASGIASSKDGFGKFTRSTAATEAQISNLAGSTPQEALLFVAGVGLRDGLDSSLKALRESGVAGADAMLSDVEQSARVSLQNDVVPLLGSAYSIAAGLDDTQSLSGWVSFQTESTNPSRLDAALQGLLRGVEEQCRCVTGAVIDRVGDLVRVRWPSKALPASSLMNDPGFTQIRSRLPKTALSLFYLNPRAVPRGLRDQVPAGATNLRIDQLLGIGASNSASKDVFRFDLVVPVGPGQ